MTEAWTSKALEEFSRFRNGKSIKPGTSGAYPVYGSNGLIGSADEFMYEAAIILGRVGAYCGSVELSEGKFWASDNTIVVEAISDEADLWFLYYLLKDANLNQHAGGAAQPLLTQSRLKPLQFSIPPLSKQRQVASILRIYDDLIENNTRRIEILEEMARRLYEEWFVHFRFTGPEEGSLPFEEVNIFDVFTVKYGKGLPKKNLIGGAEFPVYGAAKIIGRYNTYNYEGRQIIAGCRGSVGEFRITEPKSFVTNNSFIFSPSTADDFFWGYQALKSRGLKDVVGGAAQPQITLDGLRNVTLAYPAHDVRKAYSGLVSPMFSMMWALEKKNANLLAQRDLLLPRLVSGEVDVSDITMLDDMEVEVA